MRRHEELYDLLFDYANLRTEVEQVLVGINWTVCRAGAIGMAKTCLPARGNPSDRTMPLQGRSVAELSQWLQVGPVSGSNWTCRCQRGCQP